MLYIIGFIAYIPFVYYVSVWIHEMGHVIFGRLAGYRSTAVGTGFGRLLLRWRIGSLIFFVRKGSGGAAYSYSRARALSKRQRLLSHGGGIIANIIAAVFFSVIAFISRSTLSWLAVPIICNLYLVVLSALPSKWQDANHQIESDGATLLQIIRPRRKEKTNPYDLAAYRRLLQDPKEIDDREMLFHMLTAFVIPVHVWLNSKEKTIAFEDQAKTLCDSGDAWEKAHLSMALALTQLLVNPAEAIDHVLEAEQRFHAIGDDTSARYARSLLTSAYFESGEIEKSAELLADLRSPEKLSDQSDATFGTRLEIAILIARDELSQAKSLAEDLWTREKSHGCFIYGRVADALAASSQHAEASLFYERTLDGLQGYFLQQSKSEDRMDFATNHRENLIQAAKCFRDMGDESKAVEVETLFDRAGEEDAREHKRAKQDYRKRHKKMIFQSQLNICGLWVNGVITVTTWQSANFLHSDPTSLLCLASYTCLILGFALFAFHSKSWYEDCAGYIGIALATIPWILTRI